MELKEVRLDDFGPYPAYVVGHWNGFAVPYFTRETCERIAGGFGDGGYSLEWIGDTLTLVTDPERISVDDEDVRRVCSSRMIDGQLTWNIADGWVWTEER